VARSLFLEVRRGSTSESAEAATWWEAEVVPIVEEPWDLFYESSPRIAGEMYREARLFESEYSPIGGAVQVECG
jgi:hypothetical protein